jgi:hypothetical protein
MYIVMYSAYGFQLGFFVPGSLSVLIGVDP